MEFQIILTTVIAVCAFLTVLGVIFNWLLGPLKENQKNMEQRLSGRIDKIENKIDLILEQSNS